MSKKNKKTTEALESAVGKSSKSNKGLNLGLLLELGGVVLGSTRTRRENEFGVGNFALDYRKFGLGLATLVGQKTLQGFGNKRKNGQLKKALAGGLISPEQFAKGELPEKTKAKKGSAGRNLLVGGLVGASVYLLALPPEQRERFFKQVDTVLRQVISLAEEIQGKPYSQNYEPEKKA